MNVLLDPNDPSAIKSATEMCEYIRSEKLPVLYANIAKFVSDDENIKERVTTNAVESWNAAMIKQCDTNRNTPLNTLTEKLIECFTEQSMHVELGFKQRGLYLLKKAPAESVIAKLSQKVSNHVRLLVNDFTQRENSVNLVQLALMHKLHILTGITTTEADTYTLLARQILSKSTNVVHITNELTLPCVNIYDSISHEVPKWWTVRTDDYIWSKCRCSCNVSVYFTKLTFIRHFKVVGYAHMLWLHVTL